MGSIIPITGIVSTVVAVVVFLGAVVVYIRGASDKGTILTLEKNNEALNERVALLEADAIRDKAERVRLADRVAMLERENSELHKQRPSAEAIAELRDLVENASALLARHDVQTLALLRKGRS